MSIRHGKLSVEMLYWRATRIEMPSCLSDMRAPQAPILLTSSRSTQASVNACLWKASDCGVTLFAVPTTVIAALFAGEFVTFACALVFGEPVTGLMAGEIEMVMFPLPSELP